MGWRLTTQLPSMSNPGFVDSGLASDRRIAMRSTGKALAEQQRDFHYVFFAPSLGK